MQDLPSGTVTFLFSDVEGSTQLLERHPDVVGAALARHHELFEEAIAAHDGIIFETVATPCMQPSRSRPMPSRHRFACSAPSPARTGAISSGSCRIAIHSGEVVRRGDHYFGPALFCCARLVAITGYA